MLVSVGTWFHMEREEAVLPPQSCAADVSYSPGGWGRAFGGSTVPFYAWQWAVFTEESRTGTPDASVVSLEKWKEAGCRPEMA